MGARSGTSRSPSSFLAGAMLILGGVWFFLPLGIVLRLNLPPYAFGHEPIGVRFFQAWLPLRDAGLYGLVLVGYLLDLFHRGLLAVLMQLGLSPEKDFVGIMTIFANLSLFTHSAAMVLISSAVVLNRKLSLATRAMTLATGASLGYGFHWAPLRLLTPDYPLTLSVLAYASLAFAVTALFASSDPDDALRGTPHGIAWPRPVLTGLLAAAVLFLKPSLIIWAVLLFTIGVTGNYRRVDRWIIAGTALGAMLLALSAAWFMLLGLSFRYLVRYTWALLYEFSHLGAAEPFFRFQDFLSPGTIYFLPFLGLLLWLLIILGSIVAPGQRRWRPIPAVTLLGALFYLYVLARRPGNATTFEILIYIAVTGTLCAMLYRPRASTIVAAIWCAALLAQTAHVALVGYPQFVAGAQYTADVARSVDQHARSFGLPIVYAFPEHPPAAYDIFQSAESAALKGVLYCAIGNCTEPMRREILSRVIRPYDMIGEPTSLPSTAYVLMIADVPEAPSIALRSPVVGDALARARSCQKWQQHRHTIRVCLIPPKG